jgi:hypothetical protein
MRGYRIGEDQPGGYERHFTTGRPLRQASKSGSGQSRRLVPESTLSDSPPITGSPDGPLALRFWAKSCHPLSGARLRREVHLDIATEPLHANARAALERWPCGAASQSAIATARGKTVGVTLCKT